MRGVQVGGERDRSPEASIFYFNFLRTQILFSLSGIFQISSRTIKLFQIFFMTVFKYFTFSQETSKLLFKTWSLDLFSKLFKGTVEAVLKWSCSIFYGTLVIFVWVKMMKISLFDSIKILKLVVSKCGSL